MSDRIEVKLVRKRAKRATIASQRARPFGALRLLRAGSFARLAQIPHGAKRLFGMTIKSVNAKGTLRLR
jgi:hypothetical protein